MFSLILVIGRDCYVAGRYGERQYQEYLCYDQRSRIWKDYERACERLALLGLEVTSHFFDVREP